MVLVYQLALFVGALGQNMCCFFKMTNKFAYQYNTTNKVMVLYS